MPVNREIVKHIAKLSKLSLTDFEEEKFTLELNKILEYMEKLNSIKTDNIETMSYPVDGFNVFREDEIVNSIDREAALKNAPQRTDEFFKVPKIL
ncbi:MAG: Asp-tRNA(Asn)/Glu-tRNA(Gln) amidotransferase GatCAB subunit C [Ignavibacteriales bacterium CG_4_9_14_3_um_filter_34_10]|nr:MAG: Asp-tRNA(Asn)/Glu-tRNA(Gln) amidotransferase GatCAB subunit C [Ignavibacteriales bacterium CG_4_9_14_3_um_filter_34_10]